MSTNFKFSRPNNVTNRTSLSSQGSISSESEDDTGLNSSYEDKINFDRRSNPLNGIECKGKPTNVISLDNNGITSLYFPPSPPHELLYVPGDEMKKRMMQDKPSHPKYETFEARLESFNDPLWPEYCPLNPRDLAAAGLYYFGNYEGILDSCKCYFCDSGLCNWEEGDDAWNEHKKRNPFCKFVEKFHPDKEKRD